MVTSEVLSISEGTPSDMPARANEDHPSGDIEVAVQPDSQLTPEAFVALQSIASMKETRVKQYDPKKLFGPLTPAQMSLYDSLTAIIPEAYPSKGSLSRARAREICYMGGRALQAVPHIPAMKPSELI